MLTFMDYIQRAFDRESKWNRDNSYSTLNLTAQSLLDFPTPHSLRLHISSLPTPNLATSYTLTPSGLLTGSLSYLYSSIPLLTSSSSTKLDLHDLITGYRHLSSPIAPDPLHHWEEWHQGKRVDSKAVLLYGRLELPRNRLEALYARRRKPSQLVRIQAVSDANLPNGGTVLATVLNDYGKYSSEFLYSTDSGLLGARGLYNFGTDPREETHTPPSAASDETISAAVDKQDGLEVAQDQAGLFSLGGECYYGALNKSFGLSTGLRFTTLPTYQGFPYTMTLTLNPLMGNLSSSYSVKAGRHLAFSSRFDFNFYSYESGVRVGMELWRMTKKVDEVAWARRKIESTPGWLSGSSISSSNPVSGIETDGAPIASIIIDHQKREQKEQQEDILGVLKARVDQDWKIGLLWEGRWKELLFSVGANVDLKRREQIFRGVGLEVQYSS